MNELIKQAIKNAFLDISENNLIFTPEVFMERLCKESKALGIDFGDCNWYVLWSIKFDENIRRELNNYPIKNRDDFINALSAICKHRLEDKSNQNDRILQKAIKVLQKHHLLDCDEKTPLNIVDSKLNELLHPQPIQPKSQKKSKLDNNILKSKKPDDEILICSIKKEKLADFDISKKLFRAFYEILLQTKDEILIYDDYSILIIPSVGVYSSIAMLNDIIRTKTFIYKNKKIDLEIDFKITKIKDLV